jgi:hypothetical protein
VPHTTSQLILCPLSLQRSIISQFHTFVLATTMFSRVFHAALYLDISILTPHFTFPHVEFISIGFGSSLHPHSEHYYQLKPVVIEMCLAGAMKRFRNPLFSGMRRLRIRVSSHTHNVYSPCFMFSSHAVGAEVYRSMYSGIPEAEYVDRAGILGPLLDGLRGSHRARPLRLAI